MSLQRSLLDFIKNELGIHKFRQSHQSFFRSNAIGKEFFQILLGDYRDYIEIEAHVSLRHNRLEELYNIVLGESPNLETATLGADLGILAGGTKKRWEAADLADIPIVGNEILDLFWNVGIRFLEEYANLERMYDVFVTDGQPTDAYCSIPHIRAQKAVVAAYLLHREDSYFDLIVNKVSYLKGIDNPYIVDFLEFAFELRSKLERDQKTS
jgi:hypothetical protein